MKKAQIEITEVKEVKGFIHPNSIHAGNPNRYNSSPTHLSKEAKALLVHGIIKGAHVKFYTPSVIVTHVTGFLNYDHMDKNSWFEQNKGETTGHRGAEMFDGHGLNIAIQTKSTIQPKIKAGDIINITYTETEGKISRVRVAK